MLWGEFHAAATTGSAKNAKEYHTITTIRLKPPYHKPMSLWMNPEAIEEESHQPGKLSGGFYGTSSVVTPMTLFFERLQPSIGMVL